MRHDLVPGIVFSDYQLPDHTGTPRTLTERTALYLAPSRPFVSSSSAAFDVDARSSNVVVCGVTTLQNAFQRPTRTHRAGKGNVQEIKVFTVSRRAPQLHETPGKPFRNQGLKTDNKARCRVGDSSADTSPDTLEIDSTIQMTVEAEISEPRNLPVRWPRRCNRSRSGWSLPGAAHGRV
jgi:hypothetical protein